MKEVEARRACGCCLSSSDLIDVTDDPINLITLCFSIQISNRYSPDKSLVFICNICNEKLRDCYKFRRQILFSQTELKKLYASVDSGPESLNEIFEFDSQIKERFSSHSDNSVDANNSTMQLQCFNERNSSNLVFLRNNSEADIKHEANSYSTAKNAAFSKEGKFKRKEDVRQMRAAKQREHYAKSLPYKLDKEALICNICNKTFAAHKMLVSHMAIHYPNFVCDTCGKPFVLKRHLNIHAKSHEQKMVTCSICSKVLRSSSLGVHMKNHSDNKKHFACPHCAERFVSFDHRLKHMEKNHNIDIYKHLCKMCPKKFYMARHLTEHTRRSHFKLLNVACTVCDKGFYSTDELKKHMIKHTGEKNYQCDVCSKRFTKKWSLTLHLRSHSSVVRKHKCLQCGKDFTQKGSLKVHLNNIHKM